MQNIFNLFKEFHQVSYSISSGKVILTVFLNFHFSFLKVKIILKTACLDCHRDFTRYPWYNSVTPVNYWMADHVEHGKEELNFSKWNDYSDKRKDHKLEEIAEEVKERKMPIESYTLTHGDAKLTEAQINEVVNWVNQARLKYAFREQPQQAEGSWINEKKTINHWVCMART